MFQGFLPWLLQQKKDWVGDDGNNIDDGGHGGSPGCHPEDDVHFCFRCDLLGLTDSGQCGPNWNM